MKQVDNFNPGSWLVENKLTSQSKLNENQNALSFNGKFIDSSTIELDGVDENDYPDFADAYVSYAEYTDGTPLEDYELDKFNEQHGDVAQEMAYDRY
jgi:hypothetical protein